MIAARTKPTKRTDQWGLPVEGAVDVIDADLVLVRWDTSDGFRLGTGYLTGIEFRLSGMFSLFPVAGADETGFHNEHWEECAQTKRYYRDGKPIKLSDLRHQVRSRYLAESGDTDPTPTDTTAILNKIQRDVSPLDDPFEIMRIAVQRWPDIDPMIVPHTVG